MAIGVRMSVKKVLLGGFVGGLQGWSHFDWRLGVEGKLFKEGCG